MKVSEETRKGLEGDVRDFINLVIDIARSARHPSDIDRVGYAAFALTENIIRALEEATGGSDE